MTPILTPYDGFFQVTVEASQHNFFTFTVDLAKVIGQRVAVGTIPMDGDTISLMVSPSTTATLGERPQVLKEK